MRGILIVVGTAALAYGADSYWYHGIYFAAFRGMLSQVWVTAYLATVRAAALRMLHGKIKDRPALSSWSAVVDYLRAAMAFEPREQFRVLFLDKRNHLIADEVHQRGTIDHTPVYPRVSQGDIFFDLESDPFAGEGGLEYLFGYAFRNEDSDLKVRS